MVDGVLLLVDASEGPLPQTRFRAAQALPHTCPCSSWSTRPTARMPGSPRVGRESHDSTLDVASDLDDEAAKAAEHALGLPTLYASGRAGVVSTTEPAQRPDPDGDNLDPLFDVLLEHSRRRAGTPKLAAGMVTTSTLRRSSAAALIRIYNGRLRKGQQVAWMREVDGTPVITERQDHRVADHRGRRPHTPPTRRSAGDIVAVAGMPEIMIATHWRTPITHTRCADNRRRAAIR